MGGGDTWYAVLCPYVLAEDEAVSADDLIPLGIPYDHLAARHIHCVEFIYVTFKPCASPRIAEGKLAQSADLTHCGRRVESIDHVYLVVALVGAAQQSVGCKFCFYQGCVYFVNNRLHNCKQSGGPLIRL
jgi:hypothetical protein